MSSHNVLSRPLKAGGRKYTVSNRYVLPQCERGCGTKDPWSLEATMLMQQVAEKFNVGIQANLDGASLTVSAFSDLGISKACDALTTYFSKSGSENNIRDLSIFIASPAKDDSAPLFVLKNIVGDAGARPTLGDAVSSITWLGADPTTLIASKTKLREALLLAFDSLRYFPGKMQLRVHFGRFLLGEWKKDTEQYSLPDLFGLARHAERRGTSSFDTRFKLSVLDPFLHRLSTAYTLTPLTATSKESAGVKPSYSIVLFHKGLVIESRIDTARGPSGSMVPYFGPANAYFREKPNRKFQIMNSCPHKLNDWMIELQSFVNETELKALIPFTPDALEDIVKFTGEMWPDGFPKFHALPYPTRRYEIEWIFRKVSWSYPVNAHYHVEVNQVYNVWGSSTAAAPPTLGAGITLYSTNWDGKMEAANLALGPREWSSFDAEFLEVDPRFSRPVATWTQRDLPGPWDDFLYWVDFVQKALEETAAD